MQKKIITLVILIFLVTGCTVKYDLKIDKDGFKENITLTIPNEKGSAAWAQKTIQTKQAAMSSKSNKPSYYNSSLEMVGSDINMNYSYDYGPKAFVSAQSLSQCYNDYKVERTEKLLTLTTGDTFKCFYRESVPVMDAAQINITTDLKVKSHNADKVNGNTYTWEISKDNFQKKPIKMEIRMSNTPAIFDNGYISIIAMVGAIVIVVVLIVLYFQGRKKKVNEL